MAGAAVAKEDKETKKEPGAKKTTSPGFEPGPPKRWELQPHAVDHWATMPAQPKLESRDMGADQMI